MNKYSRIIGTGGYLPKKILTNHDLESMIDTTDEWIHTRTGIRQRHVVGEGESASTMASHASVLALETAGISPTDLDLIVVATSSPDRIFPSTACLVQNHLGAAGCAAMDVQAACAGFTYALSIADQYIRAGTAKRALVIGSEANSRIIDWTDRRTCIIFGDGAGAVVVEAVESDEPQGVISTHIHADGRYNDLLYVPNPSGVGEADREEAFMHMSGNEVFKVATKKLSLIVEETLAANNMQKSDIDWLVPHQANIRIIGAVAKKLSMSMEQVIVTIEDHANTSGASVPLALDTGIRDGRIKPGDLVMMVAFGGGFTWGSALVRM